MVVAAGTVAGTRLRYRVRRLTTLRTPLRCPAATHEDRDPGSTHADSSSVGLDQERPSATAPWQEQLSRPRPWSRNRPQHLAQSYTTIRRVKSSEKPSHGLGRDDRLACRCRGTVAEASRGRGGMVVAAGTVAGTRLRYRVRRLTTLRTPLRCPAATHEDRDPGSTHADSSSVGLDQERPSATAPWQEKLSRPRPWSRNRPQHLAQMRSPLSTTIDHGLFFGREALVVFASLAAILMAVVAIVLLLMSMHQPTLKDLCIAEDCHVHAALLDNAINQSIDACEDFRAHVCSKWSPPGERRQLRDFDTSVLEDMVFSWLFGLEETLLKGSQKFPVGHKALLMFQSCMSASSEYGSTLDQFLKFIEELGLSWPERPKQQIDALEVLLTLAHEWHVEFWFSVQIVLYGQGTREFWRLSLEPAPQLPFYLQHHRSVINSGGYYEYWSQFYTAFTNSSPVNSERRATEAARLEGDILEALNQALHVSPRRAAWFPLGEMEVYTPSIDSYRWLECLQKVTNMDPALKQRDDVVVSNRKFLLTVGEIFGNYSNEQILAFLAWQFVEHYGPVADSRLLWTRYGDQTIADTLRPAFCGFHIEVAYKAVLLAMQFALKITKEDRLQIYREFAA
ncbi:hypothetical protein HPB49_011303 [Dermacentor silvarum]|uniref:Uncharacterized protein n=1 Tax=Dermacentor silvarum TaxID=543639 RepID=A0ACB8C944_DERSI|nr:hypothetical protein HPB49_011303 [Dermacentor silvarum]